MTNDKSLQKEIIGLASAKDIAGMTKLIENIVSGKDSLDSNHQALKMAINISANMLLVDGVSGDVLGRYIAAVEKALEADPDLKKLENIDYSRIKARLAGGEFEAAVSIAFRCGEPRLRLFSVILEECGKRGDPTSAWDVLKAVLTRDLEPCDKDFANLVRSFKNQGTSNYKHNLLETFRLLDQQRECIESVELIETIFESVVVHGLTAWKDVEIPNLVGDSLCGVCPRTNVKLEPIHLTENELSEMIVLSRRLSTEASILRYGEDAPDEFNQVLATLPSPLPTVILDAANIAHTNQNFEGGFFRFDQVEDILSHFRSLGNKCIVVIHTKWLNPTRDLQLFLVQDGESKASTKRKRKTPLPQLGETTVEGRPCELMDRPETQHVLKTSSSALEEKHVVKHAVPVDLIQRWRDAGELLEIPHGQNDDWFWMHVCLLAKQSSSNQTILVSNDLMRDHLWRMKSPKFFIKFRSNHVCQYSIKFGEDKINHYEYLMPPPFSITVQKHSQGGKTVYHIPYKVTDDSDTKIRWLVIEL